MNVAEELWPALNNTRVWLLAAVSWLIAVGSFIPTTRERLLALPWATIVVLGALAATGFLLVFWAVFVQSVQQAGVEPVQVFVKNPSMLPDAERIEQAVGPHGGDLRTVHPRLVCTECNAFVYLTQPRGFKTDAVRAECDCQYGDPTRQALPDGWLRLTNRGGVEA